MKKILISTFCLVLFTSFNNTFAQTKNAGPIIEEFGKVFRVKNPDVKVDIEKEFKVVFDVTGSSEDMGELNLSFETAARFLNMHAQAGVPKDQLKVALVVHSKAGKDLLNNAAYQSRYKVDNPQPEYFPGMTVTGKVWIENQETKDKKLKNLGFL